MCAHAPTFLGRLLAGAALVSSFCTCWRILLLSAKRARRREEATLHADAPRVWYSWLPAARVLGCWHCGLS